MRRRSFPGPKTRKPSSPSRWRRSSSRTRRLAMVKADYRHKPRIGSGVRPRQDSNLRHRLRRPVLYPLSYGGMSRGRSYSSPPSLRFRVVPRLPYPASPCLRTTEVPLPRWSAYSFLGRRSPDPTAICTSAASTFSTLPPSMERPCSSTTRTICARPAARPSRRGGTGWPTLPRRSSAVPWPDWPTKRACQMT